MTRPTQPDLFASSREPARAVTAEVEPFEFRADGPECVPRPDWVVPEELRLPSDDPNWAPKGRGG